jgi:hypothetical protein
MNHHGEPRRSFSDFSYWCQCGKYARETRAMAAKQARILQGKGGAPGVKLRTYCCEYGGWHLTSQPAAVRAAYKDAGKR